MQLGQQRALGAQQRRHASARGPRPAVIRAAPSSLLVARAATAVEPAPASSAKDRLDAQVAVVLGTQWGDEGKGKLVDILAQQYEIVARAQVRGGAHAPALGAAELEASEEA